MAFENDIEYRIERMKNKVKGISEGLEEYKEKMDKNYTFAETIGVKPDDENPAEQIIYELNLYIEKIDEILNSINKEDEEVAKEQYNILNNMLYLDDLRFSTISELIEENNELTTKKYINKIANRANELIRLEEGKALDQKIAKLSKKSNLIEVITGKSKVKKAMLENYTLKRMELMDKNYVPEDKSVLEIVNITRNCGYNSDELNDFVAKISEQYQLGEMIENSLMVLNDSFKIPFFYNKEFVEKINDENNRMLNKITDKKIPKKVTSRIDNSSESLKHDIRTLELFSYETREKEVE